MHMVGVGASTTREDSVDRPAKTVGVGASTTRETHCDGNGMGWCFDDPSHPKIELTSIGKIVEKRLLSSERISGVKIDRYVIMPDHIHAIVILEPSLYSKRGNGSSEAPSPTNEMLPRIVSVFKRLCNKEIGENVFQRGYMEHIIRDSEDYDIRVKYIYENPIRWYYERMS